MASTSSGVRVRMAIGLSVVALSLTLASPAEASTAKTKRVSIKTNGNQANDTSYGAATSANGRYVAFYSEAPNLVKGDSNDREDVFVRDLASGKTRRVSIRSNGTQAFNGDSHSPSISADGRYVAFLSNATNLVKGDTNGFADIFVRDRAKNKTKRVSVSTGGGQVLGGGSSGPSISADGRFVAFGSTATNLVTGDTNGFPDVFVHDRAKKKTKRVSVRTGGGQVLGGDSSGPSISANGRFVAFESRATNLVAHDTNGASDVFRRGPLR